MLDMSKLALLFPIIGLAAASMHIDLKPYDNAECTNGFGKQRRGTNTLSDHHCTNMGSKDFASFRLGWHNNDHDHIDQMYCTIQVFDEDHCMGNATDSKNIQDLISKKNNIDESQCNDVDFHPDVDDPNKRNARSAKFWCERKHTVTTTSIAPTPEPETSTMVVTQPTTSTVTTAAFVTITATQIIQMPEYTMTSLVTIEPSTTVMGTVVVTHPESISTSVIVIDPAPVTMTRVETIQEAASSTAYYAMPVGGTTSTDTVVFNPTAMPEPVTTTVTTGSATETVTVMPVMA